MCLWSVIDSWLDRLSGRWDNRFLVAVAILILLTWGGMLCGQAWRRAAGFPDKSNPRQRSSTAGVLAGWFLLVFVLLLVPDLLTRRTHPSLLSAALGAGWHAACLVSLGLVTLKLARQEHEKEQN
ncbi:MAG: hypothetical protein IT436_14065 [Phycisphaerales bacterium]|nr:hypothetical protein [Phycisphaerales bacterium]